MDLGYSGELYILASDHRSSFTKRFGVEGDPTAADNQRFADGKHLIFRGGSRPRWRPAPILR
jgi:5-dehydro-2-deoxygluconokinase